MRLLNIVKKNLLKKDENLLMKTFFKIIWNILKVIAALLLLGLGALTLYILFRLEIFSQKGFYLACALLALIDLILILWMAKKKKFFGGLFCLIGVLAMIIVQCAIPLPAFALDRTIQSIQYQPDQAQSKVSLLVMEPAFAEKIEDLNGEKIGYVGDVNAPGNKKVEEEFQKSGIDVEMVSFDDLTAAAAQLKNYEIAALILNEGSYGQLLALPDFANFNDLTRPIYEADYPLDDSLQITPVNTLEEPFNVLITSVDSTSGFEKTSPSEFNLLMTINPKTKEILFTSIPMDTYVDIACEAGANGCANGQKDTIAAAGDYGMETSLKTVSQLLNTTINYSAAINLNQLSQLVDQYDGGIVLKVDEEQEAKSLDIHEGKNLFTGEKLLEYFRNRETYNDSDKDRIETQKMILNQALPKLIIHDLFRSFGQMKGIKDLIMTDMPANSFWDVIKAFSRNFSNFNVYFYTIEGKDDKQLSARFNTQSDVLQPDETSVNNARSYIQDILDGKQIDTSKNVPVQTPAANEEEPAESEQANPETAQDEAVN